MQEYGGIASASEQLHDCIVVHPAALDEHQVGLVETNHYTFRTSSGARHEKWSFVVRCEGLFVRLARNFCSGKTTTVSFYWCYTR